MVRRLAAWWVIVAVEAGNGAWAGGEDGAGELLAFHLIVVEIYAFKVVVPRGAGLAVVEEEVRTVLVRRSVLMARPVVMWDDILERNIVGVHESCGKARGAVDGLSTVVSSVFAHFDADGVEIAGAVEVGVLAAL